jgi:hypothetical protein
MKLNEKNRLILTTYAGFVNYLPQARTVRATDTMYENDVFDLPFF